MSKIKISICRGCNGLGKYTTTSFTNTGSHVVTITCPECKGTGKIVK